MTMLIEEFNEAKTQGTISFDKRNWPIIPNLGMMIPRYLWPELPEKLREHIKQFPPTLAKPSPPFSIRNFGHQLPLNCRLAEEEIELLEMGYLPTSAEDKDIDDYFRGCD